ncbi:DUF3284 domain-containing protein [Lacticaseibacillus absianus]|uniref:DUF3284 domain-containing protein n=1 Tax=Lacticaseibacillus absianus TaxID=2729623 RepID=UPI0015CE7938|nr:DUF3284 domain-containing protein [Lacticaseibacillus absianus]
MQIQMTIHAPQMYYFARLMELVQLDIQACTGKNLSMHRLCGLSYLRRLPDGQCIGTTITACVPGETFTYLQTTAHGEREIRYQLHRLDSHHVALSYSEWIEDALVPAHWWTRWARRWALERVARRISRSYASQPQLQLSPTVVLAAIER